MCACGWMPTFSWLAAEGRGGAGSGVLSRWEEALVASLQAGGQLGLLLVSGAASRASLGGREETNEVSSVRPQEPPARSDAALEHGCKSGPLCMRVQVTVCFQSFLFNVSMRSFEVFGFSLFSRVYFSGFTRLICREWKFSMLETKSIEAA